ncbi:hypothetical protein [Nonomuraea diastatica]|uniref:Uncharacterized protein n=1 Tax=Nonomuraea diastatica TaxID=1848329 RepID=A0A4R4WPY0_9ACTN|nr:hypothetical protein [Nonomuraea diastatica]TDD19484.1 hypothetical protein E1294_20950 [Nonomuraea diastatica]
MAESRRRRPIDLVLLALGPVLAAAYAAANHAAIRVAVRAQVTGPEWEGGPVGAGEMTALGADTWRLTWWIALFVGVVAIAYVVIGVLLRRRGRGRTLLLVLSGVLIVPYALAFLVALINPVHLLAGLYDSPGFASGVPGWQAGTAFIVLAAGLAQTAGLAMAASAGRRVAGAGERSTA